MLDPMRRAILSLDALGMGVFATTGAVVALEHDSGALAACLIGATAAIGGGVMRDVLVNEMPLLLQRDLYAVPALLGAALTVTVLELGAANDLALVVGTVFAAGLRLVSLWRRWSLPAPRHLD